MNGTTKPNKQEHNAHALAYLKNYTVASSCMRSLSTVIGKSVSMI